MNNGENQTMKATLTKNLTKKQLITLVESLAFALNDCALAETEIERSNAVNEVRYDMPHDLRESVFNEEFDFDTI
jgi:hypothetical protein